jgi:hypothetical protein
MNTDCNYVRQINVKTKSLLLIYIALYCVYHFALFNEKINVLLFTSAFFIVGLTPYLLVRHLKSAIIFPDNSYLHNASMLGAFALVLLSIYISFTDIFFALSGSHSELHGAGVGAGVSTPVILLIYTATLLLSRSLPVVNCEPKTKRFLISGLLFILLVAIPFSRNPALPAVFILLITLRPISIARPISLFNIALGVVLLFSLVLFDLRRALGTAAFFSGEALLDVDIIGYFADSAELQVVNRVHDALKYTNYSSLDSFVNAQLVSPFLNLFSLIDYDELPSVRLSNLYDTTGGFSMLMLAYMVSPFLVPFVSFITFGLGVVTLRVLNRFFPAYSIYSLAIVLSYLINSFRIDFAVSVKMLAGYIAPLLVLSSISSMSRIIAWTIKNVTKSNIECSPYNR